MSFLQKEIHHLFMPIAFTSYLIMYVCVCVCVGHEMLWMFGTVSFDQRFTKLPRAAYKLHHSLFLTQTDMHATE